MRRRAAPPILLLALLAGCASTAQVQPDAAPIDQGLDAAVSEEPSSGDGPGEQVAPDDNGSPLGNARRDGPAGLATSLPDGSAVPPGAVAPIPRGGRTDPIHVGFTVFDAAGISALTGRQGEAMPDDSASENEALRREIAALVKYTNATGGVGGRKVVAFPYELNAGDVEQQSRSAKCTRATEDDKVQAYIDNNGFFSEADFACFARHRVNYIGYSYMQETSWLRQHSPYVVTTYAAVDRIMLSLVSGFSQVGYFKSAKVGIMMDDLPSVTSAYKRVMEPALKRAGVVPVATAAIEANDRGIQGVQASNAVLQFKGAGVTHVIVITDVLAWLAFSNQAESQDYNPTYGFSDYQLMLGNAANFNQNGQASGSFGVSSVHNLVLSGSRERARTTSDPVDRNSPQLLPGSRRCHDVLSRYSGVNYYKGPGRSTRYFIYCEHYFLWLDVAREVGNAYTPTLWGQGLAQHPRYLSTMMHDAGYGPGAFDGALTYRVGTMSKVSGCLCFHAVREDYFPIPR